MNLKFTVKSVSLAIAAAANAFGIAYGIAVNSGGTVTGNEWIVIAWAVISAAASALAHDSGTVEVPKVQQVVK